MRVVLAEDHPLMQQMISSLVCMEYEIVAIVDRGDKILQTVDLYVPEIVILDVSLPGRNGLQVLPDLRRHHPEIAVVVLTTHSDPVYEREAYRRGADDYVVKGMASEKLLPAIRKAVVSRNTGSIEDSQHYA